MLGPVGKFHHIEYEFQLERFLNEQAQSEEQRSFFKGFSETQLFSQYCDRLMDNQTKKAS